MAEKTIALKTDYNHKLACKRFIHLDIAPEKIIPGWDNEPVFTFITKDGSHPPIEAKLLDIDTRPLNQMPSIYPSLSHGMDISTFVDQLLTQRPNIPLDQKMIIYFFEQTNQQKF